jgi:hypothetical protein
MNRPLLFVLTSLMLLTLVGCEEDELAKAVREAAEQSAEQQRRLVQLQSEVAKSASELVEADSKARTELAALQRDLQQDQAEVGRQRDRLEDDRRDIAVLRHRDPLIAAAITNIGLILACLLPLVLCIVILRSLRNPVADEEALTEFLVHEIVAEQPLLLSVEPRSPALEHTAGEEETPAMTEQV